LDKKENINVSQQQKGVKQNKTKQNVSHPNLAPVLRFGVVVVFSEEFVADFLLEAVAELRTHEREGYTRNPC
jgi:hypothetical protein